MMPYSEINIGDQYQRALHSLAWVVMEKKERLIKIQAYTKDAKPYGDPLWTGASNTLFHYRVYNGFTNEFEKHFLTMR